MVQCKNIACKQRASFGFTTNSPLTCKEHADDGMTNVVQKCCLFENCKVRPMFNIKNETKGVYCKEHKTIDMIDVIHKQCLHNGCEVRPFFNFIGQTSGVWCNEHKKDNMFHINSKKCSIKDCISTAYFNVIGAKKGMYCKEHKKEDMVNVVAKMCQHTGCEAHPTYNFKGKLPVYCNKHKADGMINVKTKRCVHDGCEAIPLYNFKGENALYCKKHITNGMVNVLDKRCIHPNCEVTPTFNLEGQTRPLYCKEHKKSDMINVNNNKCSTCKTTQVSNPKYKGLCTRCFVYTFPNEPVSRNYKVKEKHVHDFICSHYAIKTFSHDKLIDNGCSKRRPDWFFECLTHVIIIECDENQHTVYDTTCENKRIMELFTDVGNRPLVMIRFNPDSYINEDIKMPSSFKYHKISGVPMIRDSKEWQERLSKLKETIDFNILSIPDKEVTIINLFFNNN